MENLLTTACMFSAVLLFSIFNYLNRHNSDDFSIINYDDCIIFIYYYYSYMYFMSAVNLVFIVYTLKYVV